MRRLSQTGARRGVVAIALLLVAGCMARKPPDARPLDLLAVLPIELAEVETTPVVGGEEPAALDPKAGEAVTGQIYRALAHRTEFRVVPDLTVDEALRRPAVRDATPLAARARALGQEVGADGVIFGRVSRFRERVGTEYGATEPAAVSFELSLIAASDGALIWHGQFDQTQESLSANLLNWWMFWSAGPHWFSARELAGLGVDKLMPSLSRAASP